MLPAGSSPLSVAADATRRLPDPMPRASGDRLRTFTGRLLLWHAMVVVGTLLALGVVLARLFAGYLIDEVTDSLVAQARVVREALSDPSMPGSALQRDVVRLGGALEARVTVIRTDGVVLADSEKDPALMENHLNRPEVQQALAGDVGVTSRRSATTGLSYRYVALPPNDGAIVRVAIPLATVDSNLRTIRTILGTGFGVAAVAGLLALAITARGVSRPLRSITRSAERLGAGDLATAVPREGTGELAVMASTLERMRQELASRIEAAERARQARDTTLAALEEGVMLVGRDGEVRYSNPSAARLLGAVTRDIGRITPPELRALVERAGASGTAGAEVLTTTMPVRVLRAVATSILGEGNVVLVMRDVTEARTVDAIRRDFVANASHELKTPVASIQALAETLASAAVDDRDSIPRFSEQLEREAVRLSRIISDLLDLSRLEGGAGDRDEVLLDRLVVDEIAPYQERAARTGPIISVTVDRPVRIRGSARDLGLMVRNLVENALQYTRPGGSVEVSVSVDDGHALLEVADTGVGIPQRDQGRVFERFYRVDRGRSRETGGTGLGLAIVRHVAENHGGEVSVRSELGRGSRFAVRLPLGSARS
jgi:two-component system phosphate regulon sensor histidine kinase PhoR